MSLVKQPFPQLQRGHPLAKGLVGAWPFWEGSGDTLHDASGNKNHGTLTNMDPATDWVGSPYGHSLDFGGGNNGVLIGNPVELGSTSPRTVLAWVNDASWDQDGNQLVNSGAWQLSLAIDNADSGSIIFNPGDNSSTFSRKMSTSSLANNTWHHIAFTTEGTDVQAGYIDGVAQTLTAEGGWFIRDNTWLGTRSDTTSPETWQFNGLMCVACIYSRILSPIEIRDLYQDPWAMFRPRRRVSLLVPESGTSVSASASLTTAAATMDASATHEAPTFSGSANITAPASEMNASATHTAPTFEATAALTTSPAVMEASGTFSPTFTGSAAITAAAATMTATASHDTNLSTGTAELTTAPAAMDASGTFTAPVFTATAAITVPAAEMDASAQFTPPTSSGSANIIGPAAEMDGAATFAEGTFTATAAITTAPAEMTASATHVAPSFTASADLTTVAATMDASATFTTDVFTASASLVTSAAVMAATGTFVVVQRSAIITNEVIRKPQVINERIRKTSVASESIE